MKFKSFFLFLILVFPGSFVVAQNRADAPGNAVSTPDQSPDLPVSKGYLMGPGDQILTKVVGEPEYEFTATVDEDGMIEVPFANKLIVAQCRTERDVKAEIKTMLETYLRNPQLSVHIERGSRPSVSVYGEVMKSMEIKLLRNSSLIEILAVAGGVREEAGGQIQVFRTRPPACTASDDKGNWKADSSDPTDVPSRIYSLANVNNGKEDSNPVIYPGDVVVVHRAPPVYVTGEVVAGQGVYLKENGLSLTEGLAMVGGPRPGAKKDVLIYRLKPGSNPNSKERDIISANYDLIKKGQQKDVMLQAYDIVVLDKAKEPIGVTIAKFALGAGKAVVTAGANSIGYSVIY